MEPFFEPLPFRSAAVWPGRIDRNGKQIPPFLCDQRLLPLLSQFSWALTGDGRHLACIPKSWRTWLGSQNGSGNVRCHQLVWRLAYGEWPASEIDHIDQIHHNNLLENLRLITRAGNLANRSTRRADGGVVGVTYRERPGRKPHWEVTWNDVSGRRRRKCFSADQYADAVAFRLARNAELSAHYQRESEQLMAGAMVSRTRGFPRGVYRQSARLGARIRAAGRHIYLGTFDTIEQASAAVERARAVRDAGGDVDAVRAAGRDEPAQLKLFGGST